MKERLDYIDTAKGILIMTVVMGHIFQAGYVHDFIYTFHMPAFFIISGMMLNYSHAYERPMLLTLKKMVYTMVIPFFFFEACGCLLYIIRFGANQSIFGFLYNTIHLKFNNGINWYLFSLFIAKLLLVVIMKISTNRVFISATCVSLIFAGVFMPTNNNYIRIVARLFICLSFLIIGYSFSHIFGKHNAITTISALIITILVSFINGPVDLRAMHLSNAFLYYIGSLAGSYALIHVCKSINSNSIKYIGQNTLLIYGTHNIAYILIGNMLGITDFTKTPLLIGLLLFLIIMGIEFLLIRLFNKFFPFLIGKKSSTYTE